MFGKFHIEGIARIRIILAQHKIFQNNGIHGGQKVNRQPRTGPEPFYLEFEGFGEMGESGN